MAERVPVVLHLDVNSFYAQVEMALDESLRDKPLGVQQRSLIVTCNYVARDKGVPKMCSAEKAKQICPDIVLLPSIMKKYRKASRELLDLLRTFCGPSSTVQRASIDEAYIDVTSLIASEVALLDGGSPPEPCGVLKGEYSLASLKDLHLVVASNFAFKLRMHVASVLRFDTSIGVSHSKTWSKIGSDMNRPRNQTVIFDSGLPELMDQMSIKKVPGLGAKTLKTFIELCSQQEPPFVPQKMSCLKKLPRSVLVDSYGSAQGEFFFDLGQGIDQRPVEASGAPKSYSQAAAHRVRVSNLQHVYAIVTRSVEKLVLRLEEHEQLYETRAKTVTVGFTSGDNRWTNKSIPMPAKVNFGVGATESAVVDAIGLISGAVMEVISKAVRKDPVVLQSRRFSIGASNFGESMGGLKSMAEFVDPDASDIINTMLRQDEEKRKKQLEREESFGLNKFVDKSGPSVVDMMLRDVQHKEEMERKISSSQGLNKYVKPGIRMISATPVPPASVQNQGLNKYVKPGIRMISATTVPPASLQKKKSSAASLKRKSRRTLNSFLREPHESHSAKEQKLTQKKKKKKKMDVFELMSAVQACPVCLKEFSLSEIQTHVNAHFDT